ncbi:hypothetical protein NARC_190003 [Candidatus Nitrosocosmicus arcticus]|uniref:Uncharacterized protein n=1 Tax=Candidatus Nitrosocosmicus arcticus TaxID=2035267 RepID=A0A557SRD8_9ARCH|nr:hypothetical protein NARC_190003 [Candidatus Nitrosocosmicus arcticus]
MLFKTIGLCRHIIVDFNDDYFDTGYMSFLWLYDPLGVELD